MTSFSARDKQLIWHPFTQEKTAAEIITIKRGQGSYIYDENDKAYLDLISSWWVNLHGHAHPEIAQAIYKQATTLEHVIFAGFTHPPAIELCEGLKEILPNKLSRFFFSDNGSTSVEVALKMAYQYWHNKGIKKNLFLSFEGGYHGDTFGAMSVGQKSGFHDNFTELFFKVLSIPYPATWENDADIDAKEKHALTILETYLKQYGNQIAAFILEPLIQGASGMNICRASFIKKIITKVQDEGILIIFDEVMTGFGRTGTYFALSQIGNIIPDFLCLSKGITGGFLPLAMTITTDSIYNEFLSDKWDKAFPHGHSYTANPLACAAAITSLKLLRQENTQNAIKTINMAHKSGLSFLKSKCRNIEHLRMLGTIAAFDLSDAKYAHQELKNKFLEQGLLIRPLGNTIYLLPPYSITYNELETVYEKITNIIK